MKKNRHSLWASMVVALVLLAPSTFADWDEEAGYLGIQTQSMTSELRQHFGVPEDVGVLVSRVVEGSPADQAGLRAGDVLVGVEGWEIDSPRELRREIRRQNAGDEIELEVYRDRDARQLIATLEATPESWSHSFDCDGNLHCLEDVHRHIEDAFHAVDWQDMMEGIEVSLESIPWEHIGVTVHESVAEALEAMDNLEIEVDLSDLERDLERAEERIEERMERMERRLERLDRELDEDD